MKYPSMKQVETASHEQLARWYRFLPSPGASASGTDDFEDVLDHEAAIQERIIERFGCFGGMNPQLSKKIGWKE